MSSWRFLVSLHNLVNIPPTACEDPDRQFTVEARQINIGAAGLSPQKNPRSIFAAREVTESTPTVFEIRLDDPRRGQASSDCACVWQCSKDVVDVVVEVREKDRLVGSSTTFQLDVNNVINCAKLTTRIVGTEMGQVGISFSVDPGDRAGYKGRLERFLRQHNPKGLHLVQNVVDVVPELDTFTKLHKKYQLRDYTKRLNDFFGMYGPEYTQDIPSLLKQWENREEELMRNLILDNGPELCDVDFNQRLTAFLAQHRLHRSDLNVARLINTYDGDPTGLFAALTERYGAEPDPRNYLFPTTHYAPLSQATNGRSPLRGDNSYLKASPTPLRPPPQPAPEPSYSLQRTRNTDYALSDSANPSYLSLRGVSSSPVKEGVYATGHPTGVAGTSAYSHRNEAPHEPLSGGDTLQNGADGRPRDDGFYKDVVFADESAEKVSSSEFTKCTPLPQRRQQRQTSFSYVEEKDGTRGANGSLSQLWLRMNTMLRTSNQSHALQPGFFYYCSVERFRALVDSLDSFSKGERDSLEEEWNHMCKAALEETSMDQTSPGFDGALAETARVVGLHPVQFQVTGMTSFLHREQYKYFNARLASAKEAATERLVLLGGYRQLLNMARHGVAEGQGQGTEPVAVFSRSPFAQWRHSKSTCLLVCDVVVGRCYKSNPPARLPHNGTKAFLDQYDSSAFFSGGPDSSSATLAVYDAQQVLPHLLVQCTVDPALTPCPSHPDRTVEYYVVSENAVACSRCVVLGRYRGLEVLAIEEAATQARGQLSEMQRAAEGVGEAMSSFDQQLRKEESTMPTAPRRLKAQREIERIRREADEQIAKIVASVEQQDKSQRDRIRADLQETEGIRTSAAELAHHLGASQSLAGPIAVVQALQQAKHDRALESLLARAKERIPRAPLGSVHPFRDDGEVDKDPASGDVKQIKMNGGGRGGLLGGGNAIPTHSFSRVHDSYDNSAFVETPPKLPPPQGCEANNLSPCLPPPRREGVYSKYQSISSGVEVQESLRNRRFPAPHRQQLPHPMMQRSPYNVTAVPSSVRALESDTAVTALTPQSGVSHTEKGNMKERLARGWSLLHKGDESGAALEWRKVREAYGENEVPGAKARAYLAEAIEKDYETAAGWYAHCLELDPKDRLTAYNYGVLLEAFLQRPRDALTMYDRAAALGDHVAFARAEQLRAVEASMHSHSA